MPETEASVNSICIEVTEKKIEIERVVWHFAKHDEECP